jgi:hypothetical protein
MSFGCSVPGWGPSVWPGGGLHWRAGADPHLRRGAALRAAPGGTGRHLRRGLALREPPSLRRDGHVVRAECRPAIAADAAAIFALNPCCRHGPRLAGGVGTCRAAAGPEPGAGGLTQRRATQQRSAWLTCLCAFQETSTDGKTPCRRSSQQLCVFRQPYCERLRPTNRPSTTPSCAPRRQSESSPAVEAA